MAIEMPAYVRYPAAFTAMVAALPSWIGCIYLAFNLDKLQQDPWSLAFVIPLAIIPTWLGRRFFRLAGYGRSEQHRIARHVAHRSDSHRHVTVA